jgi:glucose-1-phosphate thymidylyltransferase
MKGIILHGGHGTRLRPLTHTGPKQLIPVANKPISQYVLEDLRNSGIKDITIVLGDIYPEKVKQYYGDGSSFNVKITYQTQDKPRGIAHAISLCRKQMGTRSFVVYLGDNLLKGGISHLVNEFQNLKNDAMVLLCQVKNPQQFGVAKFDEDGNLEQLVEKPKDPPSNYALTGIYFFKPIVFNMIDQLTPSWRGELEVTDAIQRLLNNNYSLGYQIVKGWWKDTGTPEDILEANRLVLDGMEPEVKGKIKNDSSLQGRITIGKDTVVDDKALIRGPTIIGENTTIEANVYIGPYTSIGSNTQIIQGEVENSIIMDNCIINVKDRITDSIISPHSRISSNGNNRLHGKKFIIGERTYIEL